MQTVNALPAGECLQKLWVLRSLQTSTKGFARAVLAIEVVSQIMAIIRTMQGGDVRAHLQTLYRLLDHRGSDVRLESGGILDSYRQAVPYPAPSWVWVTVQAYRWESTQYINVFELTAVFKFLKHANRESSWHSLRIFISPTAGVPLA